MLPAALRMELVTVCALGLGCALLGLCGLLAGAARRGRPSWRGPLAAALAVAAAGLAAWQAGLPQFAWLPTLALGVVWAACAGTRSPLLGHVGRAALAAARRPHAQAALLLAAGVGLVGGQLYWVERAYEFDETPVEEHHKTDLQPAGGRCAFTDAGKTVPLFEGRVEGEEVLALRPSLAEKVVRTGEPTPASNCHGWVFTAGRHWVRGEAVEQILKDNGYRPVSGPRAGDLVVFRDQSGQVTHSGLVRLAAADGLVLLESKWGRMGRYVHTPDEHPYVGGGRTYYRSPRPGHLLRGVEGDPAGEAPAGVAAALPAKGPG